MKFLKEVLSDSDFRALLILMTMLFILVATAIYFSTYGRYEMDEKPCAELGGYSMADMPARCYEYWTDGGK